MPGRKAHIKKARNGTNRQRCEEKRTSLLLKMQISPSLVESSIEMPQNNKEE